MRPNEYRIEGDVAYVRLTQDQEALVDLADLPQVLTVRWHAQRTSYDTYYVRSVLPDGRHITLHRLLLGAPDGVWVDHINRQPLDCRRANLRVATASENAVNRTPQSTKSGHPNIAVQRTNGHTAYLAQMIRKGVHKAKSFPYTPEGLEEAQALVARWHEDFSYEPPRTTLRRKRRAPGHEPPERQEKPLPPAHASTLAPGQALATKSCAFLGLTRGLETVLDLEDLPRVMQHRWHAIAVDGSVNYVAATINGRTTYLHRFLLGAPPGLTVDHLNHDTLDNRRANLRLKTTQENTANRAGAYTTSKTGIRGVSVHKCKPRGLMYVFRCHCASCKVAKYFPYTPEGLEEARAFATAHHAAMLGGASLTE